MNLQRSIVIRFGLCDMDQSILYPTGDIHEVCLSEVRFCDMCKATSTSYIPDDHPSLQLGKDSHTDIVWFCCIDHYCNIHDREKGLYDVYPIQFYNIYPMMNPYITAEDQGYIVQQDDKTASEF